MEKMEPGKWYLIAHCQNTDCGEPWGFQEVPTALEKIRVPSMIELTCPHCGHTAFYDHRQVACGGARRRS